MKANGKLHQSSKRYFLIIAAYENLLLVSCTCLLKLPNFLEEGDEELMLHVWEGGIASFPEFVKKSTGDSQGISKYHSKQYLGCWKQWRTKDLSDVLWPSETYENVFWSFLDLNQFQGPIGTTIIFRQCVSHIVYKKTIQYNQKATFL